MERIIIFTGKGGVGKTSVAAAHARMASAEGLKSLIVSVDMAHNLGDLLEKHIGRDITELDENLYGLEIDPVYEMESNFSHLVKAMERMFPATGDRNSEILMMPGIEELFALLRIKQIYESGEYDVIIVDCAPTGETLSLLKFPELFAWYMEKFFPIGKVAVRLMKPVSRKLFSIELPDNKAMNDIQKLYKQLLELQELLKDREVTSIRLVTLPEKMVVEETKRSYMYLNLFNFNVDGVFINRALPRDQELPFFDEWLKLQEKYIDELEMVFSDIPLFRIKWYDTEIKGIEALDRIIRDTFGRTDILKVLKDSKNEEYEKNEDGYLLKLLIPNAARDEIILHESGTDIIIRIGNFKRSIPLPYVLRKFRVAWAKFNGACLDIQFVGKDGGNEDE